MTVKQVNCAGGLNTEAAIYALTPGEAVSLLNVEVDVSGSYTTMSGMEKFDGQTDPSSEPYYLISLDGVGGISLGATIEGSESGATAVVVGVDTERKKVGVINIAGTFSLDDTIEGNEIVAAPAQSEAGTYAAHRQFRSYAQGVLRSVIQPVPGVNQVRGVVIFNGSAYAFRDHADGVTCRMYRATDGGWDEVVTSGYFLKEGRYEFRDHTFQAGSDAKKLIVVNGVNKAVIFDGATCGQLTTGMPVDIPSSVEVLPSSVLLLGYDNGSLMTSAPGDPTDFSAGSGGAEIGVSSKIIGLALQPDERVAIFCESSIRILTGKTPASFTLSVFNAETGTIRGSIANVGDSIFLSQNGLTRLSRTQSYGAFEMTSLDRKVRRLLTDAEILFSVVVRSKNQYRIFSPAGFVGFTLSGADVIGAFTGTYPSAMTCGCSAELNGDEHTLLGSVDGFVYRADAGQSHAGAKYSRVVRLAYSAFGSGQQRKKFKRLTINADSSRPVEVKIAVDLDYASGDSPRQDSFSISAGGHEPYFGSALFGDAVLGAADDAINQLYISGVGRSLAVSLLLDSAEMDPIRFGGYTIEYEMRAKTR